MAQDIMKYDSVLPEDFNGTFYFTNWTEEDFIGKWGGKGYNFPAGTTCPIIMTNQTPLEIQQIRKKFAKDLAEREYAKGPEYMRLIAQERNPDGSPRLNSIQMAGTYSLDNLGSLIQQCLDPLPVAKAGVVEVERVDTENKLTRDDDGELNSIAVKQGGDLIQEKKNFRKKALND